MKTSSAKLLRSSPAPSSRGVRSWVGSSLVAASSMTAVRAALKDFATCAERLVVGVIGDEGLARAAARSALP